MTDGDVDDRSLAGQHNPQRVCRCALIGRSPAHRLGRVDANGAVLASFRVEVSSGWSLVAGPSGPGLVNEVERCFSYPTESGVAGLGEDG